MCHINAYYCPNGVHGGRENTERRSDLRQCDRHKQHWTGYKPELRKYYHPCRKCRAEYDLRDWEQPQPLRIPRIIQWGQRMEDRHAEKSDVAESLEERYPPILHFISPFHMPRPPHSCNAGHMFGVYGRVHRPEGSSVSQSASRTNIRRQTWSFRHMIPRNTPEREIAMSGDMAGFLRLRTRLRSRMKRQLARCTERVCSQERLLQWIAEVRQHQETYRTPAPGSYEPLELQFSWC